MTNMPKKRKDLDKPLKEQTMISSKLVTSSIIGILLLICLFGGCTYINHRLGLEQDNVIEEAIESFFHEETGIDIDFSQGSPEK